MLREIVTIDDVKELSKQLILKAIRRQPEFAKGHKKPDGSEVWTKAIWRSFDDLRAYLGNGWKLYPEKPPKGSGRAAGEFLVDFILIDDRTGPRIACESELGTRTPLNAP